MASNFINTHPQFTVLNNGSFAPASDGEIEFFNVGTTGDSNRKDTYNIPNPTLPAHTNPNPVPLDGEGRSTVPIFLVGSYNTVVRDADDNQIDTSDNVQGSGDEGTATLTVDNVTELAAVDTTLFQAAYLQGTTTIADGGQSHMYFSSSSALVANGTTIIEPDVGGGRWLALASVAVKTRVVTANETYSPPINISEIKFELIGGGGGSGGCSATTGVTVSSGGGGGGGGYVLNVATTPAASYTIVVGSGGTGGAAGNNDGTAGGDSSVTDGASYTLTASGGALGEGAADSEAAPAGSAGSATGGTINKAGTDGGRSIGAGSSIATTLVNTYGGDSFLQYGADGPLPNNAGAAGDDFGAGASGAYNSISQGAGLAGAAGGAGVVIITEYL